MIEIIAEAGVNHGGNVNTAVQLIKAAKAAGADVVKFQTYDPKYAIHPDHPEYKLLESVAFERPIFKYLKLCCESEGIEFMSTPGDLVSLKFLVEELGVSRIKIGSDDLSYPPLLEAAAYYGLPMILSTGMATEVEIESAVRLIQSCRSGEPRTPGVELTLLHCVSSYPCQAKDVNLRAINTLKVEFRLPVGYSDHTKGTTACLAAAAYGACVIEKHFMLWGSKPLDEAVSCDQHKLKAMVDRIREIEIMLGDGVKAPRAAELMLKPLVTKDANGLKRGAI